MFSGVNSATQARIAEVSSEVDKTKKALQSLSDLSDKRYSSLTTSLSMTAVGVTSANNSISATQKRLEDLERQLAQTSKDQSDKIAGLNQEIANLRARIVQLENNFQAFKDEQEQVFKDLFNELMKPFIKQLQDQAELIKSQGSLIRELQEAQMPAVLRNALQTNRAKLELEERRAKSGDSDIVLIVEKGTGTPPASSVHEDIASEKKSAVAAHLPETFMLAGNPLTDSGNVSPTGCNPRVYTKEELARVLAATGDAYLLKSLVKSDS